MWPNPHFPISSFSLKFLNLFQVLHYSPFGNTMQWKLVSGRNYSIDLLYKSVGWFLYDADESFFNWQLFPKQNMVYILGPL